MMGGLAFMTGLPGRPMRAGASVNDIMGAMFGVIAIQGAIREREHTGRGQEVQAALFENNVFLMAQAILAEATTGEISEPWSVKERPWPVYDLFTTKDGTQLFFGIIGDGQWKDFCLEFGKPEWLTDPRLQTNKDRSAARPWMLPMITKMIEARHVDELTPIFERLALPFVHRSVGPAIWSMILISRRRAGCSTSHCRTASVPKRLHCRLPLMAFARHQPAEFLRSGPTRAAYFATST